MLDYQPAPAKLLNNLNTVVLITNKELQIIYVNQAAEALFATGVKQLQGHLLTDFFVPGILQDQRLRAARRRGEDFTENEISLIFRDNRTALIDLTVTNMQNQNHRQIVFEARVVDQQKRISRENQQNAQHYAARELVRGLAHEIKNPLGGIRGAAQLLAKRLQKPDDLEFTQMIVEQSDRLRNLVDRLLGPNTLPRRQWCNVHQTLERVRSLVTVDPENSVTLIRDYDPSIPEVYIDPDMIQQALLNIVRNSVQALGQARSTNPTIVIISRVERQMTIHGKRHPLVAQLSVRDNGPGIPSEIRDTLFYPMVSTKTGGSGLGLSIAQTLIDHHSGRIDIDSSPGHTEVKMYLPIERKEPL